MKKLNILSYLLAVLLISPNLALAWSIPGIACSIQSIVQIAFVVAAVVYFLWYGIMFLMAAGDASKVGTARQGVLWGIVGVIVGAIALGIIDAVINYFNLPAVAGVC